MDHFPDGPFGGPERDSDLPKPAQQIGPQKSLRLNWGQKAGSRLLCCLGCLFLCQQLQQGASCLSPTLAPGPPVRAEVAPEGTAGGQLAAESQLPRVGTPHLFASPSCRQLSFCR